MSELEQLRTHLKTMEAIRETYDKDADFTTLVNNMRDRIARLEAETADPWREAKGWVSSWRGQDDYPVVVKYIDHLTAEVARLEKRVAELGEAQVWGVHSQVDGHLKRAFVTKAEAEAEDAKATTRKMPSTCTAVFMAGQPTFQEVRVSRPAEIVAALNKAQEGETKYRVGRDQAWRRVAELEKTSEIVRRLAEATTKEVNPAESYKRIGYEAAKLWAEMKGAGDEQA